MKTSLDIPEKDLWDVLRFTKAKTKRAAIVTVIADVLAGRSLRFVISSFRPITERLSNQPCDRLGRVCDT